MSHDVDYAKEKSTIVILLWMLIAIVCLSACGNQVVEPTSNNTDALTSENEDKQFEPILYSLSDKSLIIFDAEDSWTNSHLKVDNAVVRGDRTASAKWDGIDTNQYFEIKCDTDFRLYDDLKMWVYSERATNTEINISINCQKSLGYEGKTAYFYKSFTVDWEGWKELSFNLNYFESNYYPDYSKATSLIVTSTAFGSTPDPTTVLYFDSIELSGREYSFDKTAEEMNPSIDAILECVENTLVYGNPEYYREKLDKIMSDYNEEGIPFEADTSSISCLTYIYSRILTMTEGYVSGGRADKELLNKIERSLDYMHKNYYADRTLHKFDTDNWYAWQISVPVRLSQILTLLRNDISEEEISLYLEPVKLNSYLPSNKMANRIEIGYACIVSSALERDYGRLVQSRELLNECFEYVDKGDGFYRDGSFIQHEIVAYTGDYGLVMLDGLAEIIYLLNDTGFSFSEDKIERQFDWLKDSFVPFIYHGAVTGCVRGRAISLEGDEWSDIGQGLTAVKGLLKMREYVDESGKNYITELLEDWCFYNRDYYEEKLDPYSLELLARITNKQHDLSLVKYYPSMDRLAVHRDQYAFYLSMSSSRIAKYEAINNANGNGWYTGEGMTYLYLLPDDYDERYWGNVNRYRIPGTTVSTVERTKENISSEDTLTDCDYVGGLAEGGKCAIAAMKFKASTDDMDFTSDLEGNKAWFVFEDYIVCAGNSIKSTDNSPIETVILNRKNESGGKIEDNNGSIFIPNYGGIVILDERMQYRIEQTDGFDEIYATHGDNPLDATYAYAAIPLAREVFDLESISSDIQIIQNDNSVTAVKDISSDTISYVFWKSGECEGITVSEPCIIMVTRDGMTICDPTMKIEEITVSLGEKEYSINGLTMGNAKSVVR